MPRNAEQFLQFLTLISGSSNEDDSVELELLIPLLSDKIRQENGNPYSDSNLRGVLRNIARFGIIDFVSKNDKTIIQLCLALENEGENDLGQIILDSLVRLRFENDPYIIDMLFDYTQVINESNEEVLSNFDFMERTSSQSEEVPNGNPVSGYDYSELTKEGKDRTVRRLLKSFNILVYYFLAAEGNIR